MGHPIAEGKRRSKSPFYAPHSSPDHPKCQGKCCPNFTEFSTQNPVFPKKPHRGNPFFVHPETGIRASIPVPGGISLLSILSVPRPNPGKFAGLSRSGRSFFHPFLRPDIGETPHLFPRKTFRRIHVLSTASVRRISARNPVNPPVSPQKIPGQRDAFPLLSAGVRAGPARLTRPEPTRLRQGNGKFCQTISFYFSENPNLESPHTPTVHAQHVHPWRPSVTTRHVLQQFALSHSHGESVRATLSRSSEPTTPQDRRSTPLPLEKQCLA